MFRSCVRGSNIYRNFRCGRHRHVVYCWNSIGYSPAGIRDRNRFLKLTTVAGTFATVLLVCFWWFNSDIAHATARLRGDIIEPEQRILHVTGIPGEAKEVTVSFRNHSLRKVTVYGGTRTCYLHVYNSLPADILVGDRQEFVIQVVIPRKPGADGHTAPVSFWTDHPDQRVVTVYVKFHVTDGQP